MENPESRLTKVFFWSIGSIVAAAQSGLGSVVAPSLFVTCQSAAMGGYGAATVFGLVQVVGGAMAVSAGTVIGRMNSWL